MSHYYSKEVNLDSHEETIIYHYKGHNVTFISDNGVFSKQRIDYGSRVLLDTIQINDEKSLLDVGCGYGTLGVSLKVMNPKLKVTMVDINERAVLLANKAIHINKLTDIEAIQSYIYENVNGTYDIVISNPPIRAGKKVVFEILEKAYDHLNEGGYLMIVIQKKQGAPSAKKKMEEIFNNCEIVNKDKGYYILKSVKKTL
jgi:16S rRNA (guanine1207-N2)-methyltransferase